MWGLVIRSEQGKIVFIVAYDVLNVRLTCPSLGKPILKGSVSSLALHIPNRRCFSLSLFRSVSLEEVEGDGSKLTTHNDLLKIRNLFHSFFHL